MHLRHTSARPDGSLVTRQSNLVQVVEEYHVEHDGDFDDLVSLKGLLRTTSCGPRHRHSHGPATRRSWPSGLTQDEVLEVITGCGANVVGCQQQ
jgi:hypothetical protein